MTPPERKRCPARALGQQVAGTATRLNKISEVSHGRPELGRNTAGGDRQTAAHGRGQRGVGEPVPGRLGPQLRRRLGRLGREVGRDRVVHQGGCDRRDRRPPPWRGNVQVAHFQVATQLDRREQRAQVRLEVRGRGRPVAQLDRTAGPPRERD
jgi:hypothetical protein